MKTVNFIEAVEYAKKGKEVYIEHEEENYYLIFQKNDIGIVDRYDYKIFKKGEYIYQENTSNDIEFYLNKWTVKDEEEDLIPPAVPCEYEPKSL